MATIDVKDAAGVTQTVGKYIPGRQAAAASAPVVLSTEDQTAIGEPATAAAAADGTGDYGLIAAAKRALLNWAALLARVPTLGPKAAAGSVSTVDALVSAVFMSVQTSATGATFVALGAQACTTLEVKNTRPGAADIEVRRGASGATVCVPAGAADVFSGITDASDLQVRRWDQINTQVTISWEARS